VSVRAIVVTVVLLAISSLLFAEGEKESFLEIVKGNYWKYDVVERERKRQGEIRVTETGKEGEFKVELKGMDGPGDDMAWKLDKEYMYWRLEGTFDWKVLKFKAKKGESWTTVAAPPGMEEKIVIKSELADIEDVKTPAGSFAKCFKVVSNVAQEDEIISMWWAQGVGLVQLRVMRKGNVTDSWVLREYSVGPEISDEELKSFLEKSDIVALVTVPKDCAGAKKAQVKVGGIFKGEPEEKDGQIVISMPDDAAETDVYEPGDFLVFIKKDGDSLKLLRNPVKSARLLLDRLTKLVTPPDQTVEKLKELCDAADIIAGVEIVVLEERGDFSYYVAKLLSTAKGAEGREYLDVLSIKGVEFKKDEKYIFFLVETEKSGRKMAKLVDAVKGVLEYDEALVGELKKIANGSR